MSVLRSNICKAMTEEVWQRLRQAGIVTVTDFVSRDKEEIAQSCGIAFKDVMSISRVLLAQFSALPVSSLDLYTDLLASQSIVSSGIHSFDDLLEGGFYAGEVCELAGEAASGKSQVCVLCAVTQAYGHELSSVYINTGGSFSAQSALRFIPDSESTGKSEAALSRIRRLEAHDVYSLMSVLQQLSLAIKSQGQSEINGVRLVIVDCVASVFSPILGGQQMDSLALTEQLGIQLKQLAVDFNIVVLVTNNVTARFDGEHQPSLGRVWSHVPHTRVLLEKNFASPIASNSCIKATILKSSRMLTGGTTTINLSSLTADTCAGNG